MTEDIAPYGAMPSSDFASQYRRICEAAACRTQAELADFLGIRQSGISDAMRRNVIPSDWLITLLEKKRINPNWIRYGNGAKYLAPADSVQAMPHVARVTEVRPPEECSAQELFNELVRRALEK